MVVLGTGMGLTSAPATEAIMGVVPAAKAGVGSAVNDATRLLGGTLGVAVIGSVFASLYASRLTSGLPAGVPASAARAAGESVGAGLSVSGPFGPAVHEAASRRLLRRLPHRQLRRRRRCRGRSRDGVRAAARPAGRGPPRPGDGMSIDAALDRNRAFAAAGGHQGAVVLPHLRLFVIACLDPRVDPAHVLGLGLSDAIVVRNVGGRVTPEVIDDVAFIAQIAERVFPDGPLFEVAVIHHTQCGAGALADDGFRHRYAQRIGASEAALLQRAIVDPGATVRADVELLRSAPSIPSRVSVAGYVYDVTTGLVDSVMPPAGVEPAHPL